MSEGHSTRRRFLTGAALAAAGAGAVTLGSDSTVRAAETPAGRFEFEGAHQQGITTPVQSAAAFVALDVTATNRAELVELFRTITQQARFLTKGGDPPNLGISAPPADNGVLGPTVPADGLTVTLGVGASLFDHRFGLQSRKPATLTTMSDAPFPNDFLQSAVCDGDLLLQLCANHSDTVIHALRQITKVTRGGMQIRWRQDAFHSPPRPTGTPRNLMGFKDGIANPNTHSPQLMRKLIWAEGGVNGEPQWTTGGTYHVVRLIRMLIEFWDRIDLREQEQIIGRRKATGAPGTGGTEFTPPDYLKDPEGEAILFTAHIRKANPRTAKTNDSRILRRGYNYDNGIDLNGELDQGLAFAAFNQDLERQFKTVQRRLINEPLVDYIEPFGGGYFFALPGVTSSADWLGRTLLT
jgi:deferrochelatase/peroxidase EfeB